MLGQNLNNIKDIEFNINQNNITCSINNIKINVITKIDGYIIAICEKINNISKNKKDY